MDMKKKGKKPKVNELSMSARDIKKESLVLEELKSLEKLIQRNSKKN